MNLLEHVSPVPEREGTRVASVPAGALMQAGTPQVLRGVARDWALVAAGRTGTDVAMDWLRRAWNGRPLLHSRGPEGGDGRIFYNADFTAIEGSVERGGMDAFLAALAARLGDPSAPTMYLASAPVEACLTGFQDANPLRLDPAGINAPPRIWIGNRTIASCHHDSMDNLACCAVGRRRFTLFPPEQVANLYPGPLEPTPGGRVVSIVDFAKPDFTRFPRLRTALAHAQSAVLEPGDAIYIPSLWWHHVEALAPFNVLVNYWWSLAPDWMPAPADALLHALWTLRDRPVREKDAWRALFDYYVFGDPGQAAQHLPRAARGSLGPLDENLARRLRAQLTDRLQR